MSFQKDYLFFFALAFDGFFFAFDFFALAIGLYAT